MTPTALAERANHLVTEELSWINGEVGCGVFTLCLLSQGLNSDLQSLTQERNGLHSDVSTLEQRIASVENENKVLQEKVTSLTEEKTATENEVVLLKETLQTVEKKKQVSVSASQTLELIVQFSVNFCVFKSSRTYSVWQISEFPCVNDNDGKNKQDYKIQQQRRGRYSIIPFWDEFFLLFSFPGTLGSDQELIVWRQQASGYGWKLGKNAAWFREEISSKRIHLFLFYMVLEVWTVRVWWWLLKKEGCHKGNSAINRTDRYRSRFRIFLLAR